MYSQKIIDLSRAKMEDLLAKQMPHGLVEYTPEEVKDFNLRFQGLFDTRGQATRELSREESSFITNERIFTKISWRYWAERYCIISLKAQALGALYPLWESQEVILEAIADKQWERFDQGHPDGIVADLLKDRQVGGSTLAEAFIGHRTTTHGNVNGLLASDVPDNSAFLYDMYERIVDNLPWYLKPTITERVKNDEMVYATGTRLMVGASKSTRGADNTDTGASRKGQLGRGKTLSLVHLSELATYTNPGQVDSALDSGVAVSPFTLYIKESSAQGRGPMNWWHQEWQVAKGGKGRPFAIFIGWYMEKSRHWLPYPGGWVPNEITLKHAQRIEESSPRWLKGRKYVCTKEQLYWYEMARATATAKDDLESFLQEHPADDEEAFQYSGKSVFPVMLRERVKAQSRPIGALVEVRTNRELGLAL